MFFVGLFAEQIQEFRSGANRQNVETVQSKEEIKRLKTFLKDSRDKLAELEEKVRHAFSSNKLMNFK